MSKGRVCTFVEEYNGHRIFSCTEPGLAGVIYKVEHDKYHIFFEIDEARDYIDEFGRVIGK